MITRVRQRETINRYLVENRFVPICYVYLKNKNDFDCGNKPTVPFSLEALSILLFQCSVRLALEIVEESQHGVLPPGSKMKI